MAMISRKVLLQLKPVLLMIFIAAYMALLSMLNVYRVINNKHTNAIDQSAKQISEYSYIAKKLGVHNIGTDCFRRCGEFSDKIKKMLNTMLRYFSMPVRNGLEMPQMVQQHIGRKLTGISGRHNGLSKWKM